MLKFLSRKTLLIPLSLLVPIAINNNIDRNNNTSTNREDNLWIPPTRQLLIEKLKKEQFDLLIIGGGATGTGCALDAATRGLKVALV
jgi:glycerol-3-phosphate dehydrogenase